MDKHIIYTFLYRHYTETLLSLYRYILIVLKKDRRLIKTENLIMFILFMILLPTIAVMVIGMFLGILYCYGWLIVKLEKKFTFVYDLDYTTSGFIIIFMTFWTCILILGSILIILDNGNVLS